jgi:hypothetical protein
MSRRRPSRRRGAGAAAADRPISGGNEQLVSRPEGDWVVRAITGSGATKRYRCPGCEQAIPMATPHVVAWPVEARELGSDPLSERRHWHTGCWRAAQRRHP